MKNKELAISGVMRKFQIEKGELENHCPDLIKTGTLSLADSIYLLAITSTKDFKFKSPKGDLTELVVPF